ncbi:hypothetical protein CARUB_v10022809mg [Capsella rubella]|uniref:non-specific serine/threonine protein kinase n=1 Tax=Capsella rubella TaxID=81985 RepID=R0FVT9_9BRAS|nr:hypothetical protein CARUB_v10022809mg [Capsella rubella]
MGAKCCKCRKGSVESVKGSVMALSRTSRLADLREQARDSEEMIVEETRDAAGPSEPKPRGPISRRSEAEVQARDLKDMVVEKTRDDAGPPELITPSPTSRLSEVGKISKSVWCQGETSGTKESPKNLDPDEVSSYEASNFLWSTGMLSDPIPSGFYSMVPVERLMLSESIPTLEEIDALGEERLKADVICVNFEVDKQLTLIMEYYIRLVEGLHSEPVTVIKKTAGLVADVYKGRHLPIQARSRQSFKAHGFPLLGQIKHDSCRVRAILFKVLADAVGLETTLVVGFPSDLTSPASVDSCYHMSVVVAVNDVEVLVDLKRCPGQLRPFSPEEVYMAHISMAWQSDYVDNGFCVSPLEPNSPMEQSGPPSVLQSGLRAKSLPSSPQNCQFQSFVRSEPSHQDISHMWNEVLGSPMFQNKPLLPFEEWNINFSEMKVGSSVGSGSSGVVCRGIWNKTDVAIKILFGQQLTVENMEVFCNEIFILSRIRHPNVILFIGACTKPPQLSLVTEYMKRGSLYDLLRTRKRKMSWERILNILRDICRGLMGIHQMGIVHRDLKSANCLLSKGIVKICDFGLSRMMKGPTVKDTAAAGTPEWMAPELIRNEPITEKCDIFSFGVIMWELCTLSKPWDGVPKEKVCPLNKNDT